MNRPNIVFILADDMGYGDMACNFPDSKIPTPHLDRLATQGMRFTDAHAPSSVCTPSRYAVLTGRYCWRSRMKEGIVWNWDGALVEPDRLTVAGLLREQGYRTHCVGKWHLGWDWPLTDGSHANDHLPFAEYGNETRMSVGELVDYSQPIKGGPVDRGFDTYFGDDVPNFPPYTWFENDRVTEVPTVPKPEDMYGLNGDAVPGWDLEAVMPELTRRAVQTIDDAGDDPFFLYFPLTAPHTPIVPTAAFRGRSECGDYGDFVCQVDGTVGAIMDALERKGIADNTLLIFTSDNGPEDLAWGCIKDFQHYSMANLRGIKCDAWEGGHRVPYIARWPDVIPAGTTCKHVTMLGDLMATCAEITGAEFPDDAGEDSVSILPLLRGDSDEGGVRAFTVHHSFQNRYAIRKGDWVFIDDPTGGDREEPDWFRAERGYTDHAFPGELYNLADDVSERRNLYGAHPDIVRELKDLLEQVKAGSVKATIQKGRES